MALLHLSKKLNLDFSLCNHHELSGLLWLSLAHSGSPWLTLAHSGSLWLSLALSGLLSCSLWLPLARSCSLRLPIALRICVQHPRSAHKALAQLAAALLRCNTFCFSGCNHHFEFRHNEREFQQLARTKEISNGDPVLQLCMYFGLCIHPWRSAACTPCHCSHVGPHLGTQVPMATFFRF